MYSIHVHVSKYGTLHIIAQRPTSYMYIIEQIFLPIRSVPTLHTALNSLPEELISTGVLEDVNDHTGQVVLKRCAGNDSGLLHMYVNMEQGIAKCPLVQVLYGNKRERNYNMPLHVDL